MKFFLSRFLLVLFFSALCLLSSACKNPQEAKRKRAELESSQRDTTGRFVNPLRAKSGVENVEGWRQSIGNVDSLVTPQQPTIPNH